MAGANRPCPRRPLDQALRIPQVLREYNGGNPWSPAQVAEAMRRRPENRELLLHHNRVARLWLDNRHARHFGDCAHRARAEDRVSQNTRGGAESHPRRLPESRSCSAESLSTSGATSCPSAGSWTTPCRRPSVSTQSFTTSSSMSSSGTVGSSASALSSMCAAPREQPPGRMAVPVLLRRALSVTRSPSRRRREPGRTRRRAS